MIARSVSWIGVDHLEHHDAEFAEDDLSAEFAVTFYFTEGERLDVRLQIDVTHGWPMWVSYVFHLRDRDDQSIVRLDNVPHHRDLENFPHHMHIGPDEIAQPLTSESKRNVLRLIQMGIAHNREPFLPFPFEGES